MGTPPVGYQLRSVQQGTTIAIRSRYTASRLAERHTDKSDPHSDQAVHTEAALSAEQHAFSQRSGGAGAATVRLRCHSEH